MGQNIWYYLQGSMSGTAQINQGPFHIGAVNQLLQLEAVGGLNFQSFTDVTPFVLTNDILWGVQLVPHGSAPLDVLTSTDNYQWPIRQMIAPIGYDAVYAPSSATSVVLAGFPLTKLWRGQLMLQADTDMYLSFGRPFGGSFLNANAVGDLRAWWA